MNSSAHYHADVDAATLDFLASLLIVLSVFLYVLSLEPSILQFVT